MRIKVLWVGKTQEDWVRRGVEEYAGRIRRYCPLEIAEAKEEKGGLPDLMRQREGDRLARLIPGNARLVLLDERGEEMTSVGFSSFLDKWRESGIPELVFAIGGAYGFSEGFRSRANRSIALSSMTLTHQMVRVFLLEQIYRGFTIINKEQYHH